MVSLLCGLLLAGAAPAWAPAQAAIPAAAMSALKNATYYVAEYDRRVTLRHGLYESVRPTPESLLSGKYLRVQLVAAAAGDLSGKGKEDAAVIFASSGGGSGVFYELAAMLRQDGGYRQEASTMLGDRVKIRSLAVRSGVIEVQLVTHGPEDPACCPTVVETQRYRLQGGKLVPLKSRTE